MSKSASHIETLRKQTRFLPPPRSCGLLKKLRCTLNFEKRAWAAGANTLPESMKSGRGSLFGPVVAAAVILDPAHRIRGLARFETAPGRAPRRTRDSDSPAFDRLGHCRGGFRPHRSNQYLPGFATRHAACSAATGAGGGLSSGRCGQLDCELPQQPIIHGDALSASIAAASIIAKVERDRMISAWDPVFPMYGLASNKGYCTPHHLAALREHGPSPLHRQSFSPVWSAPIPQEVLGFMLDESACRGPSGRRRSRWQRSWGRSAAPLIRTVL